MGSPSAALPRDRTSLPHENHSKINEQIIISIPPETDLMLSHRCCIYRVPECLRKVDAAAYTPQLISIGPFHFNNQKLKPMEKQKMVYLRYFFERLTDEHRDLDLKKLTEYKAFLLREKQEISCHYSEKIHEIVEKKFLSIIFLDSVFIVELFLRNLDKNKQNDDYMFTKSWLSSGMRRDLLLLENQIPFFVLKKLYDLVVPNCDHHSFHRLALNYFEYPIHIDDQSRLANVRHFTDLVRRTFRPSRPKFYPYESKVQMSVTKLQMAGINFENAPGKLWNKKDLNLQEIRVLLQKLDMAGISTARLEDFIVRKIEKEEKEGWVSRRKIDNSLVERLIKEWETDEGVENFSMITPVEVEKLMSLKKAGVSFEKIPDISILDVKFKKADFLDLLPCLGCFPYFNVFKARLLIPQFRVDDTTEHKLRNLIAYEQCHDRTKTYVCNYVCLLNSLIATAEDVDLLVQSKIIHHELGSNEDVATLINSLSKNLVISEDCFGEIITKLHDHYSKSWNRSIAAFRSVYFNDLWRASSSVVGFAVLVLTIVSLVQSVFS